MNKGEAKKHFKDRHASSNGASCSCVYKIGDEAIDFLTLHGVENSILFILILLKLIIGITDPASQGKFFEKLMLERTADLKPNMSTIYDFDPGSQLREVITYYVLLLYFS